LNSIKNRLLEIVDDLLDMVGLVRVTHYDAMARSYMLRIEPKEGATDVCDTSEDDDDLFI